MVPMTSLDRRRFLAAGLSAASLLLGVSSSPARATEGDWPRWRGPNFDDVSKEAGLLKEWPEGGPPLAWKATGIGSAYSSVSIAGGKIFTTGVADDAVSVHALDMAGKKLWSAPLGEAGGKYGYPGGRTTPTVDGDLVYALAPFGDLACFSVADGKKVWSKNLVSDFGGRVGGWKYAESVLIDGDHLICTPGGPKGTLLALNKKTGERIWQTADWTDGAEYSSPVLATIDGVKQYVQLTQQSVAGVSAEDGKVLWKAARPGKTAVIPTPVVSGNLVFVTSGYEVGCDLFKATKSGDGFKAEPVYTHDQNKAMANHHGGVILLDGKVYGYSGGAKNPSKPEEQPGWTCMDLATGALIWRENKALGKGTIAYADGRLYLRGEGVKGTVVLIEASPAGFKEHGRFDPPERSKQNAWSHMVIAGGKLYVRDQDVLLCYDVKAK
jgi:outer membrane protein assembly factor BamB